MKRKSLIIGMGIGQLYKTVLTNLGHEVITVDSDISKGADLPNVEAALYAHAPFDTVHICTPNFTHESIARKVAGVSSIIFVEKPGLETRASWEKLLNDFPRTRFMMVKNNMWRNNISDLQKLASEAKSVNIQWIRKNCIPHPGSWFTTKKLAFGGVSRDLMPHLLSWFIALNPKWDKEQVTKQEALQCHKLENIDSTEYGAVNPNGTYDVDDRCHISFGDKWMLVADWRNMSKDDSSIEFVMEDDNVTRFELGWCPEDAYQSMIADAITNINDYEFWLNQIKQDLWIHDKIEQYE